MTSRTVKTILPAPTELVGIYMELADTHLRTRWCRANVEATDRELLTTELSRRKVYRQAEGVWIGVRETTVTRRVTVNGARKILEQRWPELLERVCVEPMSAAETARGGARFVPYFNSVGKAWERNFPEYAAVLPFPAYNRALPWKLIDHRTQAVDEISRLSAVDSQLRARLDGIITARWPGLVDGGSVHHQVFEGATFRIQGRSKAVV